MPFSPKLALSPAVPVQSRVAITHIVAIYEQQCGDMALAEGFPSHSARSKMGQPNETLSIAFLHLTSAAPHPSTDTEPDLIPDCQPQHCTFTTLHEGSIHLNIWRSGDHRRHKSSSLDKKEALDVIACACVLFKQYRDIFVVVVFCCHIPCIEKKHHSLFSSSSFLLSYFPTSCQGSV